MKGTNPVTEKLPEEPTIELLIRSMYRATVTVVFCNGTTFNKMISYLLSIFLLTNSDTISAQFSDEVQNTLLHKHFN